MPGSPRRAARVAKKALESSRSTLLLTDRQITKIARALAEPRRVTILKQLGQSCSGVTCSALTVSGEVSAPTISHHLKELKNAGLIEMTKQGKFAHLTLQRPVLEAYLASLGGILYSRTK